jgi:hypothetical protein
MIVLELRLLLVEVHVSEEISLLNAKRRPS